MTAWLLWLLQCPPASVWRPYLRLLPAERDMCCLLNYSPEEAAALQLPGLVVRMRARAAQRTPLSARAMAHADAPRFPLTLVCDACDLK